MLSWLLFFLVLVSLISAVFTGSTGALTPALLEGARNGAALLLTLGGPLVFWSGLSGVLSESGLLSYWARFTRPLLLFLIRPQSADDELILPLTENFSANLLGVGAAATPAGLRAATLLDGRKDEEGLARLALLNSRSVQLLPFTAASLASSFGDPAPFALLPVILPASFLSLAVSFLCFGFLSRLIRRRHAGV